MKNKIKKISLLTILTLASATAMAGDRHDRDHYRYDDYDYGRHEKARVVDVEPIYRSVRVATPHRECWDEPRYQRGSHYNSYTSTIAGGIIGGVVGNQFGKGSGNTAMTVAGTLLGGSVGRDLGRDEHYVNRYQETCRTTDRYHHEQRIDGYHVTYRYHGQLYTTHMNHHPGKFIPVDVHVQPRHRREY